MMHGQKKSYGLFILQETFKAQSGNAFWLAK
jgi:hypothetical protein